MAMELTVLQKRSTIRTGIWRLYHHPTEALPDGAVDSGLCPHLLAICGLFLQAETQE